MITRNLEILFDLCTKAHTMKIIWKCGNHIVNTHRGKSVFARISKKIKINV